MFAWLRTQKAEWLRRRRAKQVAIQAFQQSIERRPAWASIIGVESNRFVVRVCFGNTRPPHRAYFGVNWETLACERLEDYDGDRAIWR